MSNQILVKRSSVQGKVPATTDIALGELAINTYDGKLFLQKNNGTASIVEVGGVSSVAGKTGAVTLVASDVSALPISGGTLTGALTLNADPTTALGAATKQYVDGRPVTATTLYATNGTTVIATTGNSSAVNYLNVTNAITNNRIYVNAAGTDTNIPLWVLSKGTGDLMLGSSAAAALNVSGAVTAMNGLKITGAASGAGPTFSSFTNGSDANVDMNFAPLGTGKLNFKNVATIIAGTAAAPSLVLAADATTGMYGAANSLSFAAGGVNVLTMSSSLASFNKPLAVNGNVIANLVLTNVATGISAAGTTQATATGLSASINVISTVAAGAGVALPIITTGMLITVINTSSNAVLVYPATGNNAQIESLGVNAAYSLGAGAKLEFVAVTNTQWYALTAVLA